MLRDGKIIQNLINRPIEKHWTPITARKDENI